MSSGYTRQSAANIASGQPVTSAPVNNEFNQLVAAFSGTTGHDHSGGVGLGPQLGPAAFGTLSGASTGILVATSSTAFTTATITGTSGKITVTNGSGVAGNPTITIDAAYVGQSSITTLGTIGTGVWQGTLVGVTYGGTGANLSATGGTSQVLKQTSVGGVVSVAQLAASDLSNGNTGSGLNVLQTSPSLITPALGVATATSINGLAITTSTGTLTIAGGKIVTHNSTTTFAGTDGKTVTFNATLTFAGTDATTMTFPGTSGAVTTADSTTTFTNKTFDTAGTGNVFKINGTSITAVNGTGAVSLTTSPTFVTPILGAATATSINKMAITAPATSSTLAVADGKTFTVSNTLTLTGTDGSSAAFGTGGIVAYKGTDLSQFASTTSAQLAGVLSDETGTGVAVFSTNPVLTTPTLAATPAAGDNSLKIIDSAYVDRGASGASMVLLSTAVASNSASIIFSSIPSGYNEYVLTIQNMSPTVSSIAQLFLSEDNGSTYAATGYQCASYEADVAGASGVNVTTTYWQIGGVNPVALTAGTNSTITFYGLSTASVYHAYHSLAETWGAGTVSISMQGGTYSGDQNVINAIKIQFASGNVSVGNFALYGIRKV